MPKTIEVRIRKPHSVAKPKAGQVKTPKVVPLPAEVPQTLGKVTRAETAEHRVKVLKAKFTDARLAAKAEAKKKGLMPNAV